MELNNTHLLIIGCIAFSLVTAGIVGGLLISTSINDDAQNQTSLNDQDNSAKVSPSISEDKMSNLENLKSRLEESGFNDVRVYSSPEKEYELVYIGSRENTELAINMVAEDYSEVYEGHLDSLIVRTDSLEAVISKDLVEAYTNDSINEKGYKKAITTRSID
jgi:hypothetical protein